MTAANHATMPPMADAQDKGEKILALNRPVAEYWHAMVRFLVLSNAGGVVAVLSFLGASSNANHGAWLALVPLGFFFTGMVSAGIATFVVAGQALSNAVIATGRGLEVPAELPWATKWIIAIRRASPWPEILAFGFFILGGISGLVFLCMLIRASDSAA